MSDTEAVERVARALLPYVRCGACRIAPYSPCMDCMDRAHNAAVSALAAAGLLVTPGQRKTIRERRRAPEVTP